MTYTLAIGGDMLLATVPDGADIAAAVTAEAAKSGFTPPSYGVVVGCTLTNEEPDDGAAVVWASGNAGWVIDEAGMDWKFAIRA